MLLKIENQLAFNNLTLLILIDARLGAGGLCQGAAWDYYLSVSDQGQGQFC